MASLQQGRFYPPLCLPLSSASSPLLSSHLGAPPSPLPRLRPLSTLASSLDLATQILGIKTVRHQKQNKPGLVNKNLHRGGERPRRSERLTDYASGAICGMSRGSEQFERSIVLRGKTCDDMRAKHPVFVMFLKGTAVWRSVNQWPL